VIKIDIDMRDATNAEIDAFYGMPGLGDVLRELKDNANRYNAILTTREPGDVSEGLATLMLDFMRAERMQVGNVIPEKSFRFTFVPSLNPRQQEMLPHLLESLVVSRLLQKDDGVYRLTKEGYQFLYVLDGPT
jgi:hypothetical protein